MALLQCLIAGLAWSAEGVHHFTWSAISASQWEDQGFAVTLTARDSAGQIVTNFSGTVSLSAMSPDGPATNMILGRVEHSDYFDHGAFTLGYAFTPNTDLLVTHLRHYAGSKVSIWTDAGDLLSSQDVMSVSGTWRETPLASPVALTSGNKYRIAFHVSGTNYYWRNDGSSVFRHGTIDGSYETVGDSFPASPDSVQWWLVDLRYAVCAAAPASISPPTVGLVNGIWAGTVLVPSPVNSLMVRAADGHGHHGDSTPLQVLPARERRLQIKLTNNQLELTWPVSAEGFILERTDSLSWPFHWSLVTNAAAAFGSQMILTNEVDSGRWFYRLKR